MSVPRRVIIDCDAGLDDAWAIFMILAAHHNQKLDTKIEAITCVFGNTPLYHVVRNVTRVLQTAKETNIPVYSGAEYALAINFKRTTPPFHGNDGFGDANLGPIEPKLEKEDAVSAIMRLAEQYEKGTLTFLALGPLTNLAIAVQAKPSIRDKFKEILILGGNRTGHGNLTICGECNFVLDPEAARVVLEKFTCPITIIPLETFSSVYTRRFRELRDTALGSMNTEQIKLMNKTEEKQLAMTEGVWSVADAVAAAIFIDPKVIKASERRYCTVELQGSFTRGMMVVERRQPWAPNAFTETNATIVTDVDQELFEKLVIAGAGGAPYK